MLILATCPHCKYARLIRFREVGRLTDGRIIQTWSGPEACEHLHALDEVASRLYHTYRPGGRRVRTDRTGIRAQVITPDFLTTKGTTDEI